MDFANSKKLIFTLCLFTAAFFVQGQSALKGWSIDPSIHIGRIIKHSPKLLFEVDGLTTAVELSFNYQTFGKKEWNQFQRYPKMGISLFYHDLGASNIFGEAISLIPNINSPILSLRKIQVGLRFGIGLAYLTKPFNPIDNPTNNAIGSSLNAGVLLEGNGDLDINEHWALVCALSLLHYSNGASHLPNLGLNVPSLKLGVRYKPQALPPSAYVRHDVSKKKEKRWGVQAWAALAFRERGVPNGPGEPIYALSLAANYYLNKVNRLSSGFEYEYNKSVFEFAKHVYAFDTEEEAKRRSRRMQFFVADEFLFGDWGVTILIGVYTSSKSYILPAPIYNKTIVRYYIPTKTKVKINVGVYLKSHFVIAEYMGFGVGVSF
ncbi:MAG: hypothetical protein ACI8YQ_001201 [Polaribacter sp.]|jgi:hypothetical protein